MKKTALVLTGVGLGAVIFGMWSKPQFPRPINPKPAKGAALESEPTRTPAFAITATTPAASAVPPKIERTNEIKDLRFYFSRLSALDLCKNGHCPYAKTDARSYEFARGQDLKKTLAEMAEMVRTGHIEQPEIAEAARKYLASPDGHVQEGALDLLATQPPSPENMHAVLGHVISGYDPQLIEQGMLELGRYHDAGDTAKISQALGESMMSGAPFVAREISQRIGPFVNANTVSFFKDLAGSLPEQSVYRANLEKTLALYAKQNG